MIELGSTVQHSLTPFKGTVVNRTEYLHGTPRYGVTSSDLQEGKPVTEYFEESELGVIAGPRVLDNSAQSHGSFMRDEATRNAAKTPKPTER